MCGRYDFDDSKDIFEINRILDEINSKLQDKNAYKTGEIFPTDNVPIFSHSSNMINTEIMKWGFPRWDNKGVIINARSETCAKKKMFSDSLFEKRCVIPSTGFYEWQKIDASKKKDKYIFNMENSPMLYMAGLYDSFKVDDDLKKCFVILTTEANSSISDIHTRMPVILYENELEDWLFDIDYIDRIFRRDDVHLNRKIILKKELQLSI